MAIIQSILAFGNVKGASAQAAVQALEPALCHVLTAGNRRNIDDTVMALREAGAVTKGGEFAANVKGDILKALIDATEAAIKAQGTVRPDGMKGRATAQEQDAARAMAETICTAFLEAVKQAAEARKASRKAPAEKPVKGSATGEGEGEGEGSATGEGEGEGSATGEGEDLAPKSIDLDELRALQRQAGEAVKLRSMVSSLSDERDALADALAAVTQERDALKAQLAAMMAPKPAKRAKKPAPAPVEALAA